MQFTRRGRDIQLEHEATHSLNAPEVRGGIGGEPSQLRGLGFRV